MTFRPFIPAFIAFTLAWAAQPIPLSRQLSTIEDDSNLHPALLNLGAIWPVDTDTSSTRNISSTFGPRVYRAAIRYDFHRGIDISAGTGTPVVAALDGTLYGTRVYSGGGNTVIIDHPVSILFHGQTRTRMTSFYMHLDSFHPDIAAGSKGDAITAGQIIGYVGQTGAAVSPHLHFEIRLGSRCSLEYQLANPTKSCASFGHDPHVHPLGLFPAPTDASDDIQLSEVDPLTATQDGVIEISSTDDFPIANRYELHVVRVDGATELIAVLDYNLREGFDATSTDSLDDPQTDSGLPRIVPLSFGVSAETWKVQYVIPGGFSTKAVGEVFRLVLKNVYDETFTLDIGDPSDSW